MDIRYIFVLFITLLACENGAASVLNWLWGKSSDESTVLVADGVPLISIPYEAMTEDEKFLQEAAKFTDIQVSSPLETCQHKVVMRIRTSCSDMSEEQLAKLSVNLLNCQSAVEGRKIFPCTEEMSLKQCTTDMDADMWNAYHLMSNRARAVCYAARSTQFRALTELTVNKLMQTAHSQIQALTSLKENQERLEQQTIDALSSLSESNKALLTQQQHLKDAQTIAHKLVTTNLRELNNEKALIRAGHAQLAEMTEEIKSKLEKANQDIIQQAAERGENHKELLEDLMNLQEQTRLIWDKIETSTNRIFEQHEEAINQLERLKEINETIQYIWNVTNTMRTEINHKLGWITEYIGDTGEQLHRVYRISMHIVYILVAMIVASFLQAPFLTRATIMGIVPVNLIAYMQKGAEACLDFTSITALIFLITAMHFVMVGIQYIFGPKTVKTTETERIVHQNGVSKNNVHEYTSSSYSQPPKIPLYSRIMKSIQNMCGIIFNQLHSGKEKIVTLVQAAASWSRQSFTAHEELSCSYMPSRKTREDVIYHEREFPSISEDATDMENSHLMSERHSNFDDLDSLIDAHELRLRLRRKRADDSVVREYPSSVSRSVSPSRRSPRSCSALTRTGRKCRLFATHGQNFCSRHSAGSSVMGD